MGKNQRDPYLCVNRNRVFQLETEIRNLKAENDRLEVYSRKQMQTLHGAKLLTDAQMQLDSAARVNVQQKGRAPAGSQVDRAQMLCYK